MSIRFMDSVGHYTSATDIALKYESINTVTVQATAGRFGGPSLRTTTFTAFLMKILDSQATWIVNFCCAKSTVTTSADTIIMFLDGTTVHVDIRTDTAGHLIGTRNGTALGTSTLTITANVQHYYEVKVTISDTVGEITVKVDGATFLNLTNVDTRNGANATADRMKWQQGSAGTNVDISQIFIQDGTSSGDFIGDVRIACQFASGAGNYSQWTPSAGSNYQNVDEAAEDGDTTYNETDVVNEIDTYAMTDFALGGTVKAVQVVMHARKTDAGVRQIADVFRISTTDYVGNTKTLATTYQMHIDIHVLSPATAAAWTESEINGAELGVKLIA